MGKRTMEGGLSTVQGAGADIWANADGFHFLYQIRGGEVEAVVRVTSQEPTDPWAKAGLMVRESLSPGSRHFTVAATPAHGAIVLGREFTGQRSSVDFGSDLTPPYWLKLLRQSGFLSAYTSRDGASWSWVASEAMDLTIQRAVRDPRHQR